MCACVYPLGVDASACKRVSEREREREREKIHAVLQVKYY